MMGMQDQGKPNIVAEKIDSFYWHLNAQTKLRSNAAFFSSKSPCSSDRGGSSF